MGERLQVAQQGRQADPRTVEPAVQEALVVVFPAVPVVLPMQGVHLGLDPEAARTAGPVASAQGVPRTGSGQRALERVVPMSG
jgi:hypothetical protein